MRTYFRISLLILFAGLAVQSNAQIGDNDPTPTQPGEGVETFIAVEEMPKFPGGEDSLYKFIAANTVYPEQARKKGIQGKVIVGFVVDTAGNVIEAQAINFRSVDPMLAAEAVRVVKTFPRFKPGKQNGKTVRTQYQVPIKFTLD